MIESIALFICTHAHYAHLIIFAMLLLAGLNVPFSEDVLLIVGGMIASTCIPEHTLRMFIWLFLGCILSAWEAYWIGRKLGPKLYDMRWFKHFFTKYRVEKLHEYYEKYGIWTFIVGRFCPGGIRNALFMTSGLGRMPFNVFILRDTTACLISSLVLFSLGHYFGQNWKTLYHFFETFDLIFFGLILLAIAGFAFSHWYQKKILNGK